MVDLNMVNLNMVNLNKQENDLERRCVLQLAWLRRHPKVLTPCCEAPMCFKCKANWHDSIDCLQMMQDLVTGMVDVQYCPSCNVPTIKAEGCNHMICVSRMWLGS
ncbi:unnamed protein product [Discosporangium mesarthrocarpum]